MADNTDREREEELFDIIRSPRRLDDLNEADDGSQYLNNTGEGDGKIFDLDDRADEVMTMIMIMMTQTMIMMTNTILILK